jgi:hypothetical protein
MKFLVNGVDIGDQIHKFRITETEIAFELEYDFDASKIDRVLFPLYCDYLTFQVDIDDTFSRMCTLEEYQPVSGPIGDLSPAVTITLVRKTDE